MNSCFKNISEADHPLHGIRVILSTTAILISQWCAEATSSRDLIMCIPSQLVTRHSVTLLRQLEVDTGGTIYTTEIGKCYVLICLSSYNKMPQNVRLRNNRN